VARRGRHDLPAIQDKRARVVELRAQGKTWQQIADLTGYANASSASKAWHRAIQQHPDQAVDAIRAQEKTRLEQMDSVMSGIIANPPIRATSIGRVMWDPRTCTCGVKGDTKRGHADDCQVAPVLDASAVVRATAERRAIGESLRRPTAADGAAPAAGHADAEIRLMAAIDAASRDRGQRGHRSAPPPLPLAPATRA